MLAGSPSLGGSTPVPTMAGAGADG
jgi:hypothetical protein